MLQNITSYGWDVDCFMFPKLIVVKFGGSCLRDLPAIEIIADIIVARKRTIQGALLVVVSALYGLTDQLLALSQCASSALLDRESDMLISIGERMTMALLAMSLIKRGESAISFTGSQAGIITCSHFGEARILDVRPKRLCTHICSGKVVIVAGFQGMSRSGEVTTLGRGGSDVTAVALGISLGAEIVELYKDVDGIFTSDPKVNFFAKKFTSLSYEEAEKIVRKSGGRIIHPRALSLASNNNVPLGIRSFCCPNKLGTKICMQKKGQKKKKGEHSVVYEKPFCPPHIE